jgi:hypothetical protein
MALFSAFLLALALAFGLSPARAADPAPKADAAAPAVKRMTQDLTDATVKMTVDVAKGTDPDEAADSTAPDEKPKAKRGRARIQIDGDEDFDISGPGWNIAKKNPWIIGLVFLVVGSIFLTPVILLIGIIWYKLRKTRLQNEAMLRLAEKGVVPPALAADALASSSSPSSVAPQLYQQAVAMRKRVAWSDLRKGIILSMVGLAFLLYSITSEGEANWIGLILLFVGVGYIALWWLEGRHAPPGVANAGNGGATGPTRGGNSSVSGPGGV